MEFRKTSPGNMALAAGLSACAVLPLMELAARSGGAAPWLAFAGSAIATWALLARPVVPSWLAPLVLSGLALTAGVAAACSGAGADRLATGLCWAGLLTIAGLAVGLLLAPACGATPVGADTMASLPENRTPAGPLSGPALRAEDGAGAREAEAARRWTTPGELMMHSWTRSHAAGEERFEGRLTMTLGAGQRQAYVHLPFTPFFHAAPCADCETFGEEEASAEFDILRPYGGRLTVRRRGPCGDPATVEVHIAIFTTTALSRAA